MLTYWTLQTMMHRWLYSTVFSIEFFPIFLFFFPPDLYTHISLIGITVFFDYMPLLFSFTNVPNDLQYVLTRLYLN